MRFVGLLLLLSTLTVAQSRPVDSANSSITVHAYKSGLFSFAGHDHIIRAPISSGTIDKTKSAIEFIVSTKDMEVLDPGESAKNKQEIRDTMLGPKLLDADRYPDIKFRSTNIDQHTPATFEVHGELTLHGQTRSITLDVRKEGDHYAGQTRLKQTDYGLTPVAVAGGTIKVKDELTIEFSLK